MPISPSRPDGLVTQLLANNGQNGFANVTVGTGLAYNTGTKTLTATATGGVTSVTGNIVNNTNPAIPVVTQVNTDATLTDPANPGTPLNFNMYAAIISLDFTGPWGMGVNVSAAINYSSIRGETIVRIASIIAAAAPPLGFIVSTTPLPANQNLWPVHDQTFPVIVQDNGLGTNGRLIIKSTGYIEIYKDANLSNFSISSTCGMYETSISYTL